MLLLVDITWGYLDLSRAIRVIRIQGYSLRSWGSCRFGKHVLGFSPFRFFSTYVFLGVPDLFASLSYRAFCEQRVESCWLVRIPGVQRCRTAKGINFLPARFLWFPLPWGKQLPLHPHCGALSAGMVPVLPHSRFDLPLGTLRKVIFWSFSLDIIRYH